VADTLIPPTPGDSLTAPAGARPVMVAIAGDSAAGKTTLTAGLVAALGRDRVTGVCVDDYHRYDREERRSLPFTPLHPECNHVGIMEQHLHLLAAGQPILKPTYDHATGTFGRQERVQPQEFVIIEGLLPLHTRAMRSCFDVRVYLDPPEQIRREWKVRRDCSRRGYTPEQVLAELERREPESAAFIRPQRSHADIVARFHLGAGAAPGDALSATLLLRPTIPHPDLSAVLGDDSAEAVHLVLMRDEDGKPVDALHIDGHAPRELSREVERHIWSGLHVPGELPGTLGQIEPGARSEPLALSELILLFHMLQAQAAATAGAAHA
jgi:phosphoribulokinase